MTFIGKWIAILLLGFVSFVAAPAVLSTHSLLANPVKQNAGNPSVRVWVNTNSGVYHCPGTRWYGATKEGEYMTQRQAQNKGYRPAYGRVCE